MMLKIITGFFLILCPLSHLRSEEIAIQATLNTTEAAVGEQVTYSISVSGSVANIPQPQIPALNDFKVYNAGTSQSVQFINGRVSSSVVYNYALVPIREGEFTIPPAQLVYNNKTYQTEPLLLKVVKQKQQTGQEPSAPPAVQGEERFFGNQETGELFVKAILSKETVFVNEPVIFTYKLYFRNISISPQIGIQKMPDLSGFWVEDIPPDKITARQSTEILSGKKYNTFILDSKILFPASPGKRYIDTVKFNFVVDDFFSFFGRRIERDCNPVSLTAIPLPDMNKPVDFKGSVGDYRMDSSLSRKEIVQNEPFSFKVVISGTGNIKSISDPFPPDMRNFRIYDRHVSLNIQKSSSGVSGNKTFEYILIPEQAGRMEIPPFRFVYYNYRTRQYQTLSTKRQSFMIKPGKPGSAGTPFSSSFRSQNDVTLIGKDIRFIKDSIRVIKNQGDYFYRDSSLIFFILIPLLFLGGAYIRYLYSLRLASDITFARASRAYRLAKKNLMAAEKNLGKKEADALYTCLEKALMGYLGDKFNIPSSDLMVERIGKVLEQKNAPAALVRSIEELYSAVAAFKYSPAARTGPEGVKKLILDLHNLINVMEKDIKRKEYAL